MRKPGAKKAPAPKAPTEEQLAAEEAQRLSEEAARAYKERVQAEENEKERIAQAKLAYWAAQDKAPYWNVPLGKSAELPWLAPNSTGLLEALHRSVHVTEKVPLIIDNTEHQDVDTYYAYRSGPILEAKKMFMDERAGATRESVLDDARAKLVQAMKMGTTLYIRLANSACDFLSKYTNQESFPIEVFDFEYIKQIRENHTQGPTEYENLVGSAHPFSKALRPQDIDSGFFLAREGFDVVVCTHFKPEDVEDFLKDSIPLAKLQQVKVYH